MDTTFLFLTALLVIIVLSWWLGRKKYNLPSGPWGLPIVGYIPFLGKHPQETFLLLSETYGNVFSLRMGRDLTVILNDFSSMKEAFNNPALVDRPGLFDYHPDGLGFAGQNGTSWIEQRRHVMNFLKDIGNGTFSWETAMEEEIEDFVKLVEDFRGKPVDLSEELSTSVSNNVMSIVLSKRMDINHPGRKIVNEGADAVNKSFQPTGFVAWFTGLMTFMSKLGLTSMAVEYKKLQAFNKLIRNEMEMRKTLPGYELKEETFIDGYLMQIERLKGKNVKHFFTERNLVGTAQALVVGGSAPVKTALLWLFMIVAGHPGVQKKVQDEIDRVLGRDGKIKWMQRDKLPYTYATVQEALRWKTINPLGGAHRAQEDTRLGDYDIPKGTAILANIYGIHMDRKYWKDPSAFQPDRFLDKDGHLIMNRLESFVPFSIGRRSCPGEVITLMEVFHYFTCILQKFHVRPAIDSALDFEGVEGATLQPAPHKLRFILRD